MVQTTRPANETALEQQPPRTAWQKISRWAFTLAPWVTLGFATPIAFVLAAWVLRRRGTARAAALWVAAAIYTAALLVEITHADPAQSRRDDWIFAGCLMITMIVAGVQTIIMARRSTVR